MQLFQNHEELLTGLAKILTKVSAVLPQIEIQLDLYQEPLLQQAAEKVYSILVELFHGVIKFYEESRSKHVWKSFTQPLSVRFNPLIEVIQEQSQFMRDLASAFAKREQRQMYKLIQLMSKDISVLKIDMSRLVGEFVCKLFRLVSGWKLSVY